MTTSTQRRCGCCWQQAFRRPQGTMVSTNCTHYFIYLSTMKADQNYNQELKASIANLQSKRDALQQQINIEEEDAKKIKDEIEGLTVKLKGLNDSLARKIRTRDDYDKTIEEVDAAYRKIMESSQTLLHVLKRETKALVKKEAQNVPVPQKSNTDE